MELDIIRKISSALTERRLCEAWLVYILVELRKLLDHRHEGPKAAGQSKDHKLTQGSRDWKSPWRCSSFAQIKTDQKTGGLPGWIPAPNLHGFFVLFW